MAGLALAPVFALGELSAVRIGLVAVRAERVRKRLFEVSAVMAGSAVNRAVLAEQRKRGLGMVKLRAQASSRQLFPTGSGMAGNAAFHESPMMRVGMARRTG